ncbi:MAG: DUF1993 domain-containing protein [Myxococcales bacterium]|nr:DUF1993 domain-containing protein [Myxococcales bacterium]MCB9751404.1 DUF1993 domain-containing protein [Myxococcales bacterium]
MFNATVPQMQKMLRNLSAWIEKAIAHAEAKKFDPAVLLSARLAPDQYNFTRQVQAAADAAKGAVARLTGNKPPVHPDTETTIDELKARLNTVIDYLDGFKPEDFDGAADRWIDLPFLPGKRVSGRNFLNEMALPNFYFHVVTAYAILRHNGVELGKYDFIGSMQLEDIPSAS